MLQMYYTLIYPYLNYCVIVWRHTKKVHANYLHLIQNRIVRIITGISYLAYTNELFYKTQILKIQDLSKFSLAIYGYKLHMNDNLQLTEHNYNTRTPSHCGAPTFQRLTKSQKSLSFMGPQVWNSFPLDIRNSPSVHF